MKHFIPDDIRALRKDYGFNSSNLLTLTNPKVLKSQAIAPTAVLHLSPKYRGSCPAAGSCASLCLNTGGQSGLFEGQATAPEAPDGCSIDRPEHLLRLLVMEVCRFAHKHPTDSFEGERLGLRLNGTRLPMGELDLPTLTLIWQRTAMRLSRSGYLSDRGHC